MLILSINSHSIADNLPVATRLEFYPNKEAEEEKDLVKDVQFEHGYRLGFTENSKVQNLLARASLKHGERVWTHPYEIRGVGTLNFARLL